MPLGEPTLYPPAQTNRHTPTAGVTMYRQLSFALGACALIHAPLTAQPTTPGPAGNRQPAISQPELVKRLTTTVDSLAKIGEFSGVVLLAKNGAPVYQVAKGYADRERKIPNNLQTAFNLGSINKVFTQIAILQLQAAGKLDLDSTLATYWPDYPNQDVARKVTIRQLMRHTSGIGGNIFAAPSGGTRGDVRRLQDYLPLFVNEPLQFEPGSKNVYSNAGYIVLGLLIERLSGGDYYRYVREHIFEPAGMTRTGSFTVDSLPANTAIGYTRGARMRRPMRRFVRTPPSFPGAAAPRAADTRRRRICSTSSRRSAPTASPTDCRPDLASPAARPGSTPHSTAICPAVTTWWCSPISIRRPRCALRGSPADGSASGMADAQGRAFAPLRVSRVRTTFTHAHANRLNSSTSSAAPSLR